MLRSLLQLALALAIACSSSFAQIRNEEAFASVPAAQRQRLVARFSTYIHLLKTSNRSALEKLYDEKTLCSLCKGKCGKDCLPPVTVKVPKGYRSELLEFVPVSVSPYGSGGDWNYAIEVEQTERLSWDGKEPFIAKDKVKVFAVYERGDWYFSPISIPAMITL